MAQTTPTIREAHLFVPNLSTNNPVAVGSAEWFVWLSEETSTLFSFQTDAGSYTARKENAGSKRGSCYWKAYRKVAGKLYRAYLGKSEDLSLPRLYEIAQVLAARVAPKPAPNSKIAPARFEPPPAQAAQPLLETKLQPPRLPTHFIQRASLLKLLNNAQLRKITLIQAPAGFGKTTLAVQWLHQRQASNPDLATAWVSLDNADNDPIRFWSAIIAACQIYQNHPGITALAQLSQTGRFSFSATSLETALTFLLNDLGRAKQPGVLVLEDYHLIENERIHQTLAFFIEHLPTSLHVILLTRSEPALPLARWRIKGELVEINSNQLRFSSAETISFIEQLIPDSLSEKNILAYHKYIEGWAAGLRLLALSVQNHLNPPTEKVKLPELPVEPTQRFIQDYFLSDILATQSEALQLFLLKTGLFGRLTPGLCEAVTGLPDCAERLELVYRSGFFLEALDSSSQCYRYHALFAETLRNEVRQRLGDDSVRQLFRQATEWYVEQAMFSEAIETALAAQEFEQAAQLILNLDEAIYFAQDHTIRRWLQQLPADLLHGQPRLCFRYAQVQLFAEDVIEQSPKLAEVEDLLQLAEAGWRKQGNLPRVGLLFAFRTSVNLLEGATKAAADYARQAFQFLSPDNAQMQVQKEVEWIDWYCGCFCALGLEAFYGGKVETARQYFLKSYTLSLKNHDQVFTQIMRRMLGDICIELGELHQAASYYQQTLADNTPRTEQGADIIQTNSFAGQARLFYERNQLAKAEELATRVSTYNYHGQFTYWEEDARLRGELLKLTVWQAQGKTTEVQQELSRLFVRLQAAPGTFHLIPELLAYQTRWQLGSGALIAAERTLAHLTEYLPQLEPLQQAAYWLLVARLHLAQHEPTKALTLLEQLLIQAQQGDYNSRVLEIRLVSAVAYQNLQQEQAACQQLLQVLRQAQSEGFLRLFLDEGAAIAALLQILVPTLANNTDKTLQNYAKNILRAFGESLPGTATTVASSDNSADFELGLLSAQEQRVLYRLAAGQTNGQIAEQLIISVNTVKGHVKNIYRKCNINNRVQAAALVRRLQPQLPSVP